MENEVINRAMRPEEYRAARPQIFPSLESFRWFQRHNQQVLIESGALLRPTGRWLVNPEHFDRVVLEVGQRRANAARRG